MNRLRMSIASSALSIAFASLAMAQQAQQGGGSGGGGAQSAAQPRPSGLVRPTFTRPAPPTYPAGWKKFPSTIQGRPAQVPSPNNSVPMLYRTNPNSKLPLPPVGAPASARPDRPSGPRPTPYFPVDTVGGGYRGYGYGYGVSSGTAVSVGTGGISIDGAYSGDKTKLRFHVGSGYRGHDGRHHHHYPRYPWYSPLYRGAYWYWDWPGYGYYNPYNYIYGTSVEYVDPFVQYGAAVAQQQAQQQSSQQQPERELTPLEKADLALQYGATGQAADLYRAYLARHPDDTYASRSFAMALIDERKLDQAVAVLALAYERDPRMAQSPIDPDALAGSDMRHRARFNAVMTLANKNKTASALFAAAVLAQSEGRNDIARKLVDRAAAAGLDKRVAQEMKYAMAR